jgi:hypothetical protein
MIVVFCSDPFDEGQPDQAYAAEASAAEGLGFTRALIDYEALVYDGNPSRSVRRVARHDDLDLSVFRGWMLRPLHYSGLYEALWNRGIQLLNDPVAYSHSHYFPESYAVIAGATPRSVWTPYRRIRQLMTSWSC